jgi:hypothetical protein
MTTNDSDGSESFLARWSRRKRARRAQRDEDASASETAPGGETAASAAEPAPPAIDPATLPTPESLGVDSDYTMFMRPGVPLDLKIAGLRRAWTTDPRIAEFRGMAEYDWDFNAPGYGWLRPLDDVAKLARQVFGEPAGDPGEASAPAALAGDTTSGTGDEGQASEPAPAVAPPIAIPVSVPPPVASDPAPELPAPRRRHGGALPRRS